MASIEQGEPGNRNKNMKNKRTYFNFGWVPAPPMVGIDAEQAEIIECGMKNF
jgi:hypothetical protein